MVRKGYIDAANFFQIIFPLKRNGYELLPATYELYF